MASERMQPCSKDYIELLFHWHRYLMAASLSAGKTVLDIACGEGYGANLIASYAKKVVAVDIDPEVIVSAREKYDKDNLTFLEASAVNIPLPDSSVDLIVSFETIEHLDEQSQQQFLNEIDRILTPEGILIISTPDKHRTELSGNGNQYHIEELYLEDFEKFLREKFALVHLYFQEVNMASFVWSASERNHDKFLTDYRIVCVDNESFPTEESINLHLYIIAICSKGSKYLKKISLSSVCNDIFRKPAEALWVENNQLMSKCKELEVEVSELRENFNTYKRIVKELTDNVSVLTQHNRVFASEVTEAKQKISNLAEEKYSLYKENLELKSKLDVIYKSNSWRLVQKYWSLMDHSLAQLIIRPIMKIITCHWRSKS